jgi:hypothetical protein
MVPSSKHLAFLAGRTYEWFMVHCDVVNLGGIRGNFPNSYLKNLSEVGKFTHLAVGNS